MKKLNEQLKELAKELVIPERFKVPLSEVVNIDYIKADIPEQSRLWEEGP